MPSNPDRRRTQGLGQIFNRPDIQATPTARKPLGPPKESRLGAASSRRSLQSSLHAPILDSKTTRLMIDTPKQNKYTPITPTHAILPASLGAAPQNDALENQALTAMYEQVQRVCIDHSFAIKDLEPNQRPTNPLLRDMFEFFCARLRRAGLVETDKVFETLVALGCPYIDAQIRSVFSNTFFHANTDRLWPSVLKVLHFIAMIVSGLPINDVDPTADVLVGQYIVNEFSAEDSEKLDIDLRLFLDQCLSQSAQLEYANKSIESQIQGRKHELLLLDAVRKDSKSFDRDDAEISKFQAQANAEVLVMQQRLDHLNEHFAEVTNMHTRLAEKNEAIRRNFMASGINLARVKEITGQMQSLEQEAKLAQTELADIKDEIKATTLILHNYDAIFEAVYDDIVDALHLELPNGEIHEQIQVVSRVLAEKVERVKEEKQKCDAGVLELRKLLALLYQEFDEAIFKKTDLLSHGSATTLDTLRANLHGMQQVYQERESRQQRYWQRARCACKNKEQVLIEEILQAQVRTLELQNELEKNVVPAAVRVKEKLKALDSAHQNLAVPVQRLQAQATKFITSVGQAVKVVSKYENEIPKLTGEQRVPTIIPCKDLISLWESNLQLAILGKRK